LTRGAYKGGIIAPGINLSLDALVGNTAKLPRIAIAVPESEGVIGTNTEDQMLIGVYWGYVAMIEG
jgi:type III pantothenate kinase